MTKTELVETNEERAARLRKLSRRISRTASNLEAMYHERTTLFVALRDEARLTFREIGQLAGCTEAAVIQKYQKATGTRPEDRRNGRKAEEQ